MSEWRGHDCALCGRRITSSRHRTCSTCRGRIARGVATDAPITSPLTGTLTERFFTVFASLEPDERGCLVWPRQKGGYGRNYGWIIAPGKKMLHAHRVSYEISKGPIPDGLIVMHSCDKPPCVNPDHLSVGTHKDNSQDMVAKGRHSGLPDSARTARWAAK